MKTYKMLDISTAHISEKDSKLLSKQDLIPFTCLNYEEGFIINLSVFQNDPVQKEQQRKRFSPEFFKIIEKALEEGCTHINLDRDGEVYTEFPEFDW